MQQIAFRSAHTCTPRTQAAHLRLLVHGQLQALVEDTASAEAYYEPRHVVDVVHSFWRPWSKGTSMPVQDFLAALRPLIPRLYSISSSPLEHPTRVQVSLPLSLYHLTALCLQKHQGFLWDVFFGIQMPAPTKTTVAVRHSTCMFVAPSRQQSEAAAPISTLSPDRVTDIFRCADHGCSCALHVSGPAETGSGIELPGIWTQGDACRISMHGHVLRPGCQPCLLQASACTCEAFMPCTCSKTRSQTCTRRLLRGASRSHCFHT